MHAQGIIIVVSLCMCVCVFVATLAAISFIYKSNMQHARHLYDTLKVFDSWILLKCFVQEIWHHLLTIARLDVFC